MEKDLFISKGYYILNFIKFTKRRNLVKFILDRKNIDDKKGAE